MEVSHRLVDAAEKVLLTHRERLLLAKVKLLFVVELDVETVRADSHGLCTQLGQTLECNALEILDVARGACTF